MLVSIARKNDHGDAETGETGEKGKNSKNGNEDLETNLVQVSCIQHPITF